MHCPWKPASPEPVSGPGKLGGEILLLNWRGLEISAGSKPNMIGLLEASHAHTYAPRPICLISISNIYRYSPVFLLLTFTHHLTKKKSYSKYILGQDIPLLCSSNHTFYYLAYRAFCARFRPSQVPLTGICTL